MTAIDAFRELFIGVNTITRNRINKKFEENELSTGHAGNVIRLLRETGYLNKMGRGVFKVMKQIPENHTFADLTAEHLHRINLNRTGNLKRYAEASNLPEPKTPAEGYILIERLVRADFKAYEYLLNLPMGTDLTEQQKDEILAFYKDCFKTDLEFEIFCDQWKQYVLTCVSEITLQVLEPSQRLIVEYTAGQLSRPEYDCLMEEVKNKIKRLPNRIRA